MEETKTLEVGLQDIYKKVPSKVYRACIDNLLIPGMNRLITERVLAFLGFISDRLIHPEATFTSEMDNILNSAIKPYVDIGPSGYEVPELSQLETRAEEVAKQLNNLEK